MSAPLVIRFGAIGDLIIITPLLRSLAKKYGVSCEVVARGDWPHAIFEGLPFVKTVKTIYKKKVPYQFARDQHELVRWLRERGDSPVVLLESDQQSNRLMERAGLNHIRSSRVVPRLPNEHIIDYFARVCGFEPGDPVFERWPELIVQDAERSQLSEWLKQRNLNDCPLVLIQAGNRKTGKLFRRTKKDWPVQRWAEVIHRLLAARPEARIVLLGTEQEKWMTAQIQEQSKDARVIDVAGELTLRTLFALMERAHSMISVDTGPSHAAGALNCPIVVLFGETDPRDISPVSRFSPVMIVTGPPGAPEPPGKDEWAKHHSMDGISVDVVMDAWQKMLTARTPRK